MRPRITNHIACVFDDISIACEDKCIDFIGRYDRWFERLRFIIFMNDSGSNFVDPVDSLLAALD
jgi:hypothetical protein